MSGPDEIRRAAELIRAGGLVAFPTETVYGLGAHALDEAAVRRIYEAKGRPATSPLIVHVLNAEMARGLASEWPDAAQRLTERFWPGPLTLVLPKQAIVPDLVTAGLPSVGLRMPSHPMALALLEQARLPIAAPSANRFTHLSPTTAEHVRVGLGSAVDYVLDGGPSWVGIESTVLSLCGEPALLRPGMVTRSEIEESIGPVATTERVTGEAHTSPGLHERHYQPRTELYLGAPREGRGGYLWWSTEAPSERSVPMPRDATEYASKLYDILHALDSEGLEWIAVEPVPERAEWDGIRDRLKRASAGR